MGIKGLWKVSSNHVKRKGCCWTDLTQIISPACETWPLCEFAVVEGFRRGSEQGSALALMKIGVDGRSVEVLKLYSIYQAFEPLLNFMPVCGCTRHVLSSSTTTQVQDQAQSFTCSFTVSLDYTKQPVMSTSSSTIGTGLLQSRKNRSRSHHTSSPVASKSSSQQSDSHGTW